MDKIERGKRNLEKLRHIAQPQVWRGQVTFWNPTQADKITTTIHGTDASLITQLYDKLNTDLQESFYLRMATVYGFHKLLDYAWSHAAFKETSRSEAIA